SISNDPAIRQRCARFEKIRTRESFLCRWNATNIASCFGIVTCGLEGTAARHRQLKRVDEQFSLKFFGESGAWIDYHLPGDRIPGILFKLFQARGDCRKLFRRNARELPCDLRCVDLEKGKTQLLTRAGEYLAGWKDQARFFRSECCAPARFRRESVAAIAF